MTILLFSTVFSTIPFLFLIAPPPVQTCQTKDQFTEECTSNFGGVVDGANCFYAEGKGVPWTQANTACNQKGGVLAQIHSESELTKINNYLMKRWGPGPGKVWISLQRDNSSPTTETCPYTQNTTYWYNDGVKNPKLTVSNTWLRTQTALDQLSVGSECLIIYNHNDDQYNDFGDADCHRNYSVLCQYRSAIQNFTLTTSPCLAETPIETFSATQPQECADVCVKKVWCRSFNFGVYGSNSNCSNNVCQLFTWSVYDTCASTCQKTYTDASSPFSACYRYNYVL